MNDFDLSIIVVNYNTKEMTQDCLTSILENTRGLNYEIILIDNGSSDGSAAHFNNFFSSPRRESAPAFKIIKNNTNLGFSKANNQGLKIASGRAILLLNSDTKICDNAIGEAVKKLKSADILTVNIKSEDGKNQQAGGFGPTLFNLCCWAFFFDDLPLFNKLIKPYQISDLHFFDRDENVDWVMGAFFLMKKEVVSRIGLLDENIFMYGEEMEYCRRARNAGYKIRYYAAPSIIHYGRGSSESGEGAIIGEYRALRYFFRKYESGWQNLILKVIIKISICLRILIFSILGNPRSKIYEKAFKLS